MDISDPENGNARSEFLVLKNCSAIYYAGFDDCLDVVMSAIVSSKSPEELKLKLDQIQNLVKGKKFEHLRENLGVIGKPPF